MHLHRASVKENISLKTNNYTKFNSQCFSIRRKLIKKCSVKIAYVEAYTDKHSEKEVKAKVVRRP